VKTEGKIKNKNNTKENYHESKSGTTWEVEGEGKGVERVRKK
jgi:hypothetical protein